MARQEITSTFSDGLMMDLNPINTPKSVLTDCLNGTYITYNGNEFVLQNDMGNYKLKNCKLPTNFIPVGVKGYGDILYIVSYNPLTKEVEIGSYPAPQSIFSTGTSQDIGPDNQLTSFTINGTLQYNDIIQDQKKNLYVFMDGTDQDTYKMYPGDEFKITGLIQETLPFPYQHLNFYIIDEDNKLFDIDDTELYTNATGDYKKVFWETPGWLSAQYDLYVPDKFNLNIRSLNVPEFITDNKNTSTQSELPQPEKNQYEVSMNLSAQVIISDSLFREELLKHKIENTSQFEHLKVRFKFSCESGNFAYLAETPTQIYTGNDQTIDINCNYHNYQDDIITAYVNCTPVWFMNNPANPEDLSDYNGMVSVEAYPIIDMGNGSILEYTQFATTYKFQLNNLKNKKAIAIGENIYKWSVDNDSCTISFDINGPFVNANNITGRYEIYRVNLFNEKPDPLPEWDLNNIKSYSTWEDITKPNKEGMETAYLDQTTKERRPIEYEKITSNEFYNGETSWLLMCEGNISNLILYGQNTLNVDWLTSDKYILTNFQNTYTNPEYDENNENSQQFIITDQSNKEISFEKEGGVYLLRIILEQNQEQIADKVLPLIPSEVFNEWFGEKDNYLDENNGVTGSDWVNKYWDLISVNVLNPNFNVSFDSENLESFKVLLKHNRDEIKWEFLKDENNSSLWNKDLVIRDLTNLNLGPNRFNSNPTGIQYDIQLLPTINKVSGEINIISKATKGLWNPIGNNNIIFQANNKNIINYNNELNTYNLSQNIVIDWIANGSKNSIPKFINSRYILDSDLLINGSIDGSLVYTGSVFTDPNPGIICSCNGILIDKTNKEQKDFYTDQTIPWKETSDKDSYIFGMLGEMLNRGNCCIAPVKFTAKREVGSTFYPVLVSDIDDNPDSAGEGITWSDGGPNCQYLVMRTRGGSSNNSNKTIAIRITNENQHTFANILRYIVIYECSSSNYEDVYFSSFDLNGLTDSESITINQYTYSGQIYQLRCDDESLFNSTRLQKINSQLFENINFKFNQVISTKLPSITIILDYIKNKYYSEFYYNINDAFIDYNKKQSNSIIQSSSYPAGISLQYSEDPYMYDNYNDLTGENKTKFEEYLTLMFGETDLSKLSTPSKDTVNKTINNLTKRTDSLNYSLSNIALNIPNNGTLKYVENRKLTTSVATRTAIVLVCYQTDTLDI